MQKPLFLVALTVLAVSSRVLAHGMGPKYIPIPRLVKNLDARIAKQPHDAEAYYLLGRVHYFAFMAPTTSKEKGYRPGGTLGVYGEGGEKTRFDNGFGSDNPGKSEAPLPAAYPRNAKQQVAHIRAAVANLTKALALRGAIPKKRGKDDYSYQAEAGLFELCLACALEEGAKSAGQVGPLPGLEPTESAWREAAIQTYWMAYSRALATDLKEKSRGAGNFVSQEAGGSYKRLVEQRGGLSMQERARILGIAVTLKKLEAIPRYVTPIVFSLTPQPGLDSLLAPQTTVAFNLDGTGRRQRLSWVQPSTAILVWDPERSGKITSGMQLFGSVTWWLFWRDGYAALASLDDNHDGWLRGRELSGLSLWFDRNQNGVSDTGEVIPLDRTPVVGLCVQATGRSGRSPMSAGGVELRDGSRLPTWDWTTEVR